MFFVFFFFSSRRRHTRLQGDWSSDVCSSDLYGSARPLTELVTSVLFIPHDIAVDTGGNVYIADSGNNAIKKWSVADNAFPGWTVAKSVVASLVTSGLNSPWGVAVDAAGNVYIADTYNSAVKKYTGP